MNVTLTATAAVEKGLRAKTRPNTLTRFGMQHALIGRPCSLCLLPVAYDGKRSGERVAGSSDVGHIVALCIGGTWRESNLSRQCSTCNVDAMRAEVWDLTPFIISAPWKYTSRDVAAALRPTFVHEDSSDLPDAAARRAARAARGLPF